MPTYLLHQCGPAAVLALVVASTGSVCGLRRLCRTGTPEPGLARTSLRRLCTAFTQSYRGPAPVVPAELAALGERRRALLDEIERRDASGLARWLATGPDAGADPWEYLVDGRQREFTGSVLATVWWW